MTELVTYSTSQTSDIPAAPANTGAARIREAAEVMAMCKQLADAVCNTNMMPKHLRGKPEETAAVMLYGATLDLDPMQSVRSIYEVHGQPGLYAKAMVALVVGRGHEIWTVETSDSSVTVAGRRRGSQHVEQSTWTIQRATLAGYVPTIDPNTGNYRLNKWGKLDGNEKYLTDPQAMLYAKAASEVCRKVAPDVLAGVYAVEELQSERWDAEVVSVQRNIPADAPAADRMGAILGTKPSGADAATEAPGSGQPVEPESAPESPPDEPLLLNTRSKLAKAMYAAINEAGIPESDRIPYVAAAIGRPIESTKEMTEDEARHVLRTLDDVTDQPFATEGAES
jgi:hypothetical protein